jgi:S1-C subfamily serine protease
MIRRAIALAALLVLQALASSAIADQAKTPQSAVTPALLDAVVRIDARVPPEARTAEALGTERRGSGVVIDGDGLVVTAGYLITEAMSVEVTGPDGKPVLAAIVGLDNDSGFGLVRAREPLGVKPMPLGRSAALAATMPVLVASRGRAQAVEVVSRRPYAGYWEYLLDDAIFTAPAYLDWGGAALIGVDGKLLGVGSLLVSDAAAADVPTSGNMFMPIDRLKASLGDLLTLGRPGDPPHPWLGVNLSQLGSRILITHVSEEGPADKAGLLPGDVVTAVAGAAPHDLADFYRKLWAQGQAGTTVPLTVIEDGEEHVVTIKSMDRYKYLRLNTSY